MTFTTHFESITGTTTVNNISTEIVIPELIEENQIITRIDDSVRDVNVRLEPGEHCRLTEDTNSHQTEVAGYPTVHKTEKNNTIIVTAGITPLIDIAEGNMLAVLNLGPSLPERSQLTVDEILEHCEKLEIQSQ